MFSVGTCGGLAEGLQVGTIVICDEAIRDEGTSYHYMDPHEKAQADPLLTRRLEGVLKKQGLQISKGTSWTIDSPYRETLEEIRQFRSQGVLTVDMEAAAVFAAAKFRKIPAASLLVVSDLLGGEEWQPRFHHGPVKVGLDLAWKAALDSL